jgi:hypothetical protein
MNGADRYRRAAEIVRRVRLEMPVGVVLIDPVSHQHFEVSRANVLEALTIDTAVPELEAQTIAALYALFARAQRAAEYAAALSEAHYVAWKSKVAADARKAKKITKDEAEEAYRTHVDYVAKSTESDRYKALAGLFEDIKRAVNIKGEQLRSIVGMQRGETAARASEDAIEQRLDTLGAATEIAAIIAASGSAEAAAAEREKQD